MTHILHVYKTSLPQSTGGTEMFIDTLCRETSRYGVRNTVLSLARHPSRTPISIDGYTVYQAKENAYVASTGFSVQAFSMFASLAQKADIIHYHFPNPFADLLHFGCRLKKPCLLTYHSDIVKQKHLLTLYAPLMRCFLRSMDHIVATSPNYVSTSTVLQAFKHKVSVIPIGITLENHPPLNHERVRFWKERFPQPFFLFVGVLRYYKGLSIALEAVKGTDIQLVLGGRKAKDTEHTLRKHRDHSQGKNIHFLGFLSDEDKRALLHLCYGFVFPSSLRSEAFGLSLLEAAAYGKPLISFEIGTGTSYINVHNVTGLVVTPVQAPALRVALQDLLDHPDKASTFGKNAQRRSEKLFTADEQARSYCHFYQQILASPGYKKEADKDNISGTSTKPQGGQKVWDPKNSLL